jgi:hypothetical protein
MPSRLRRASAPALFLVAVAAIGAPARATTGPFALSLQNVGFADGGIATGYFTVDTYGFIFTPRLIYTTAGSTLAAQTYDTTNSVNNTAQTFDFVLPGYTGGLHLVFASTLDSGPVDALVLGGASYECTNYCGTVRDIISGDALIAPGQDPPYVPPPTDAPEPAAGTLLAVALATLAARRRHATSRRAEQ